MSRKLSGYSEPRDAPANRRRESRKLAAGTGWMEPLDGTGREEFRLMDTSPTGCDLPTPGPRPRTAAGSPASSRPARVGWSHWTAQGGKSSGSWTPAQADFALATVAVPSAPGRESVFTTREPKAWRCRSGTG